MRRVCRRIKSLLVLDDIEDDIVRICCLVNHLDAGADGRLRARDSLTESSLQIRPSL